MPRPRDGDSEGAVQPRHGKPEENHGASHTGGSALVCQLNSFSFFATTFISQIHNNNTSVLYRAFQKKLVVVGNKKVSAPCLSHQSSWCESRASVIH